MNGALLDLDGVVYVDDQPIAGARETIGWLTREGIAHRYLTNTSSLPRQAIVDKLAGMGITTTADQILTPAVAAAAWLGGRGIERAALLVPDATVEEFTALGVRPSGSDGGDGAVVVGDLGEAWDFPTLNRAFQLLVRDPQLPLVGLGLTRYWRADDGLRLDAGPFVRALEYAADRPAVVLGKPAGAFFDTAIDRLGVPADRVVMVGDDIRVDVQGAQRSGVRGILVRTGKFTAADLDGDVTPDATLDSIADLPCWWSAHQAAG